MEEQTVLETVDGIIVHNDSMRSHIQKHIKNSNIVNLDIFDYLISDENLLEKKQYSLEKPLIIAGNLRPHKAGYVYKLPNDLMFNLYGVGFESTKVLENINYLGSFETDNLIEIMDGSF
ncbi:MAG TPA: galactofuranosyltransferase, partial [Streptococcus sp.]|nr:galactofuranosyltransferase [Streptococcus sp.]